MIDIKDKKKCTGCGACFAVCPKNAISFFEDEEGVRYPKIDENKCIHCDRCEKTCPMLDERHGVPDREHSGEEHFYAAQLRDKSELDKVSSGGAAWALTQQIISEGGVVYGARLTDVDTVKHYRATNIDEAKRVRRSKYFQSDTSEAYRKIKDDLESGVRVLYTGTGCQVAGLNLYLGKTYDNLITCDVVCHGVPCGLAWRMYRKEKEAIEKKKMANLVFRDKSKGWSNNQYKITYEDGSEEYERSPIQDFHSGYLAGLFYRPSCGTCRFAQMPRTSDITLADFWKYQGLMLENGDLGISLVVANTSKGAMLVDAAQKYMQVETVSKENAFDSCRHLNNTPKENKYRDRFMAEVRQNGYYSALKKYLKKDNIIIKAARKVKRVINRWNQR